MRRPSMIPHTSRVVLALWLALALAACFDRPQPACAFPCGTGDSACPEGYTCAADGFCKRNDVSATAMCAEATPPDAAAAPDGAVVDGPVSDAPGPDAPGPDAATPDAAAATGGFTPE